MILLLKIDGVRPDPGAVEISEVGVVIDSFSLSLSERHEDGRQSGDLIRVQVSRSGDEATVDLLGLASSRSKLQEVVILAAADNLLDRTRIILLDAVIEEFIMMSSINVGSLEENLLFSAKGIIYEHGARRFDKRKQ